ncbi:MAG: DUF4141 domain-containing protein [Bacteroidales bacterium]|jgi:hypothetical protein|nr:DUF4141 domain-containing protein [Bacteroidales bacterium]
MKLKSKVSVICVAVCLFAGKAHAQWVVSDPGNLAQGIINSIEQIAQLSTTAGNVMKNFNETKKIFEQGKEFYDKLKQVNHLVKDARKVQKTILMIGEISEIYTINFELMLHDKYFRPEELTAIAAGYAKLLAESGDLLTEIKEVISVNGLSMSDKERMDIVDRVYHAVLNYKNLVSYYTQKNISVSYLRAKKAGDADRVMSLYGNANERYW